MDRDHFKARHASRLIVPSLAQRHGVFAMEQTHSALSRLPLYREVPVGGYEVSRFPLASFEYQFCNAVILRGICDTRLRALAHIIPQTNDAELDDFFSGMITPFPELLTGRLDALIIGTEVQANIISACDRFGVQVANTIEIPRKDEYHAPKKDLIVQGHAQKVTLLTEGERSQEIRF